MLILVAGIGKSQLEPGQESMGDAPVLLHCSLLRNPWQKVTGVLEHCREGEKIIGCPFCGVFPSDRLQKATKDVNVHFFIHSSNSCQLYRRNVLKLLRIL